MKKIGVTKQLSRIEEMYHETINVIKDNNNANWFWIERGVNQACPLNPILFNIYIADLYECLEKEQVEHKAIGKTKVRSLTYKVYNRKIPELKLNTEIKNNENENSRRWKKEFSMVLGRARIKVESIKYLYYYSVEINGNVVTVMLELL